MQPEANWILRAPTLRRKIGLLAKVQDEENLNRIRYYSYFIKTNEKYSNK